MNWGICLALAMPLARSLAIAEVSTALVETVDERLYREFLAAARLTRWMPTLLVVPSRRASLHF
jgi:hypothetical protein